MSQADPRRVEVRVLRRLPADPAGLRGRAARAGRAKCTIAHFLEASVGGGSRARTTSRWSRDRSPRPATRSGSGRSATQSTVLVTIGACATAGGIQALRNFGDVAEFTAAVYASPEYIDTLATSTPVAAHVPVDFELRGCPIDRRQLLEVIAALLAGRKPDIPDTSVCTECKRRGTDLRDGGRGHALPRPGHARRVRRAVPGPVPRLLRLLRPGSRRERARAASASCAAAA